MLVLVNEGVAGIMAAVSGILTSRLRFLKFRLIVVLLDNNIRPTFYRRVSMKKWQCVVCGLIYDEAEGWPEDGIEPGTAWDDVPEDWVCPDCGVGKEDFEMIEIS